MTSSRLGSPSEFMPVTHSLLSPAFVASTVSRGYDLGHVGNCELVKLGLNDSYRIDSPRGSLIVRVYRSEWRDADDIGWELELLEHVADKGVSVARALRDVDGHLSRRVRSPEGGRHLAVFTYAGGRPFSWKDARHCRRAGRLLAEIHAASDDFTSSYQRFELNVERLIEDPLEWIRPFLRVRPSDLEYLEGLGDRLRRTLEDVTPQLDWGPCHGDFGANNVNIGPEGELTAFDFDFGGAGWRAYDLVMVRWAHLEHCKRHSVWDSFLDGYGTVRTLSSTDLAYVSVFDAIRHLWGMGLRARNAALEGTSNIGSQYFDYRVKRFRQWEIEHQEKLSSTSEQQGDRCWGGDRSPPRGGDSPSTNRGGRPRGIRHTLRVGAAGELEDAEERGGRTLDADEQSDGGGITLTQRGTFPVTYSILSAPAVGKAVAESYELEGTVEAQLLQRGLNDSYLITTGRELFVARVYRMGWRSEDEILYEVGLLEHLADSGVPVSRAVSTRSGDFIRSLTAPEGTRFMVLFTHAPGKPMSWSVGDHCRRAGRLAARIHSVADSFRTDHDRSAIDVEYLIDGPLRRIRPFLTEREDDWNELLQLARDLKDGLTPATNGEHDWGPCHGDFGPHNLHISEDEAITAFDFDLCGAGWRAYDLVAPWGAARYGDGPQVWDLFLEGYRELRHLEEQDLQIVPLLYMASRLRAMGLRAEKVPETGRLRMGDWYLDGEMSFLRKLHEQVLDAGERE